jgi:hypothetical protein
MRHVLMLLLSYKPSVLAAAEKFLYMRLESSSHQDSKAHIPVNYTHLMRLLRVLMLFNVIHESEHWPMHRIEKALYVLKRKMKSRIHKS